MRIQHSSPHLLVRLGAAATLVATLGIGTSAGPASARAAAEPVSLADLGVDPATQTRCDPIGTRCLLPIPNDHFTVADPSTPTGRRLALSSESTPANTSGVHIDVTDQNRADGWSPGSSILVRIPDLDPARSRIPTVDAVRRSLAPDASIVLWDATAKRRHAYWADLDANVDSGEVPVLIVHPVGNFPDGHRIVVGLRSLRTTAGRPAEPTPAFAAYRDRGRTTDATFEARRPAMERVFGALRRAGVARTSLQLAWDFTVASTRSLTGRLVAMRDDTFRSLDGAAPKFTVTQVTEQPNEFFARRVQGTFEMPLYLTDDGKPGGRLVLDDRGVPERQPGTFTATYTCNLPQASTRRPARMAMYGHGLLGDQGEVNGSLTQKMSSEHGVAYCATDWYGMAEEDIGNAAAILGDLSKFPSLADRLQQGLLAFLVLGRAMTHPDGFVRDPAFQFDGRPALDRRSLFYDGNSQGAILGGALAAVAQDFRRAVLGEAGMNYSILLDRSVDFDTYLQVMRPAYPRREDRLLGFEIAQLLWDRGETNGYANHITADPLPGTPRHEVLLLGAVGDHQVSEYSLAVESITMGAAAHLPVTRPGRSALRGFRPLLDPIRRFPAAGSTYWLWDTGSPSSPITNLPPRKGHDPHDDTPNIPAVRRLKSAFMRNRGGIPNVCGTRPCTAPIPPENAD